MTFTTLIEFCENAAGVWLFWWSADIWELLLLPVGSAVEEIVGTFFDLPDVIYAPINAIFGDTSLALMCFAAAPLVVALLAIAGIVLGFIL